MVMIKDELVYRELHRLNLVRQQQQELDYIRCSMTESWVKLLVIESYLAFDSMNRTLSMTIHWKAVEQYFTVGLIVSQSEVKRLMQCLVPREKVKAWCNPMTSLIQYIA